MYSFTSFIKEVYVAESRLSFRLSKKKLSLLVRFAYLFAFVVAV